jgi:hypothetical protein
VNGHAADFLKEPIKVYVGSLTMAPINAGTNVQQHTIAYTTYMQMHRVYYGVAMRTSHNVELRAQWQLRASQYHSVSSMSILHCQCVACFTYAVPYTSDYLSFTDILLVVLLLPANTALSMLYYVLVCCVLQLWAQLAVRINS